MTLDKRRAFSFVFVFWGCSASLLLWGARISPEEHPVLPLRLGEVHVHAYVAGFVPVEPHSRELASKVQRRLDLCFRKEREEKYHEPAVRRVRNVHLLDVLHEHLAGTNCCSCCFDVVGVDPVVYFHGGSFLHTQ